MTAAASVQAASLRYAARELEKLADELERSGGGDIFDVSIGGQTLRLKRDKQVPELVRKRAPIGRAKAIIEETLRRHPQGVAAGPIIEALTKAGVKSPHESFHTHFFRGKDWIEKTGPHGHGIYRLRQGALRKSE